MLQPPGFHDDDHPKYVCRLKKSLYRLKQSPRAWFRHLRDFLVKNGFKESLADTSLFVLDTISARAFLLVHVDGIVIASSSDSTTEHIITQLWNEFSIKDLGNLCFFLRIHVTRLTEGMFLSQQQYVVNLSNDEGLDNLKPASTPMEPKLDLSLSITSRLNHLETTKYRRILGCLQHLTTTRPDISYTVSKLSQFFSSLTKCHW